MSALNVLPINTRRQFGRDFANAAIRSLSNQSAMAP